MSKQGYIKVFRSIEEWRWFRYPGMLDFWLRLLLMAEWKGEERGSIVTSISELAKETNCSEKQARTFLSHLVETGEVKIERARSRAESRAKMGTTTRTKITICKYDSYQSLGQEVGQELGQEVGQKVGQKLGQPPYSPSPSFPTTLSSTPPISPSIFEEEKKNKKDEDTDVSSRKDSPDFQFVLNRRLDKIRTVRKNELSVFVVMRLEMFGNSIVGANFARIVRREVGLVFVRAVFRSFLRGVVRAVEFFVVCHGRFAFCYKVGRVRTSRRVIRNPRVQSSWTSRQTRLI